MKHPVLIGTARIIRNLLQHSESLIQFGRVNFEREQFEQNYIVIDGLGPEVPLTRSQTYDANTEEMTYSARVSKPITIDFYGFNAYANAAKFSQMVKSQRCYDLQQTNGITLYGARAITDLKQLTGQQYGERYQIELTAHYSPAQIADILRIDSAEFGQFLID